MSTKFIPIELDRAELYNATKTQDGISSREGFKEVLALSGRDLIYAFTVSSNTGTRYHYVFTVTDGTQDVTLTIYDDYFQELQSNVVCQVYDKQAVVTHAINYSQIIVNSPGWSVPLWGFVGSVLIAAQKVESEQPDTPSLDLGTGLVTSFSDRFVWIYANQILINDPGSEPRTVTSPNAIAFEGTIIDCFQASSGGELIIITTAATYTIPPDGLTGFAFAGTISKSTHYTGLSHRNAISCRGQVLGLTRDGLMDIRTGSVTPLVTYRRARKITRTVGPGLKVDYRTGRLFSWENYVFITFAAGQPFCVVDMDNNTRSWWDSNTFTGALRGTLTTSTGDLMLAFTSNVGLLYGSVMDYTTAGIALSLPLTGITSNVIREVTSTCLSDGLVTVSSYVRGSLQTSTVPAAPNSVVIGTNLWDGTTPVIEQEFRSRRQQRAVRTDGIYLEVGFTSETVLKDVTVTTKTQSPFRPTF